MVLLDSAVEICVVAVFYFRAEDFTNGTRVGVMSVSGDLRRSLSSYGKSVSEKPLCRCHVACGTQHGIHKVALFIDRTVQIAPFSFYFDVRFKAIASGEQDQKRKERRTDPVHE